MEYMQNQKNQECEIGKQKRIPRFTTLQSQLRLPLTRTIIGYDKIQKL